MRAALLFSLPPSDVHYEPPHPHPPPRRAGLPEGSDRPSSWEVSPTEHLPLGRGYGKRLVVTGGRSSQGTSCAPCITKPGPFCCHRVRDTEMPSFAGEMEFSHQAATWRSRKRRVSHLHPQAGVEYVRGQEAGGLPCGRATAGEEEGSDPSLHSQAS